MEANSGPKTMAPIIKAVCQELTAGYARERILVEILRALERNGCTDHNWCPEPQFQRVWILSNGFMAGQAGYLPKRTPWWVKDQGPAAAAKWSADYQRGAEDRDLHYDHENPHPNYAPVPGPDEMAPADENRRAA